MLDRFYTYRQVRDFVCASTCFGTGGRSSTGFLGRDLSPHEWILSLRPQNRCG